MSLVRQLEEYLSQIQFERSRWEATVASMIDPVVVGNAKGEAIYMNPAYSELIDRTIAPSLPMEEHAAHYGLYRTDGSLYDSEDLPLQRAAIRNEEVHGLEVVHRMVSGESILTVWNASPIRSSDGEVIGAVAVGRDITEQRKSEEVRARLAAIVEASDDAIIGRSLDGTITSWNRGAEQLFGYTKEEAVGRPISIIVPDGARTELAELIARQQSSAGTERLETVRITKDSTRVLVALTISPIFDASGSLVGISTIARDVTAQRRSQDSQRFLSEVSPALSVSLEYEETLDNVVRLAVPGLADICILDLIEEGSVRQRLSSVRGSDYDHCLGAIQESYSLEGIGSSHPVWEVLRTGKTVSLRDETIGSGTSGDWGELPVGLLTAGVATCVVVPMMVGDRPIGTISYISVGRERPVDQAHIALTEEYTRRAATAIDRALLYREARNAVQARDEFLSIAAHELKTPMTSLRGFVQLAMRQIDRDGVLDPAQVHQALKVIDQQSKRLSSLISQLLDVTRLEAGRLSLERRVTDVSSLVEAAVGAAGRSNPEHLIDARIEPGVIALVDPARIDQVVSALMDNAARFSPLGTQIDIALWQTSRDSIHMCVRDRGPGVPAEQRSNIFTRFYHGHPNEQAGGMGLSLYMSREIVVLHGGSITAEFPEGGGSRFVVTLPTGLTDKE